MKPVHSIELGVCDVPSRDTVSGCRVQEISLATIEIFCPAEKAAFELVTVTVPKDSTALKPTKCSVLGVVPAALSKATVKAVPGSP